MRLIFYKDGALGDIAVLIPLFLQLREQFEGVSITLITNEGFLSPFLERSGIVNSRISSASGDIFKVFSKTGRSDFLDSLGHDRMFFVARNISEIYKQPGNSIIPPLPINDLSKFLAFYYITEVFGRLEAESLPCDWKTMQNRAQTRVNALKIEKNVNSLRLTLHPGSGSETKNVKNSSFVSLLHSIQEGKYRKTLILDPAEMERLEERIVCQYRQLVDETIISPDIDSLISLLLNTKHYFGMDSGVTHLANLFSENVYAFFGPSRRDLWSPKSRNIHSVTLSKESFAFFT